MAGFSPLTGFYSSASRLQDLGSIFWYNSQTGEWFDPTKDFDPHHPDPWFRIGADVLSDIKNQIRCWLGHILANVTTSHLTAWGMTAGDESLLRQLLVTWQVEFPAVGIANIPVNREAIGQGGFPVFDYAVDAVPGTRRLLTELPTQGEHVLISSLLLQDPEIRVVGSAQASGEMALKGKKLLQPTGKDLAADMGIPHSGHAVRYINVDRLFTGRLYLVNHHRLVGGLAKSEVDTGQQTESLLFPFVPEILEAFSPVEIEKRSRVRSTCPALTRLNSGSDLTRSTGRRANKCSNAMLPADPTPLVPQPTRENMMPRP